MACISLARALAELGQLRRALLVDLAELPFQFCYLLPEQSRLRNSSSVTRRVHCRCCMIFFSSSTRSFARCLALCVASLEATGQALNGSK